VLADSGEDLIAHCEGCDYAANVEKAVSGRDAPAGDAAPLTALATPAVTTAEDVAAFAGVDAALVIKTLVFCVSGGDADGAIVAACVRGDDQLQAVKLIHALGADALEMASDAQIEEIGGVTGFVGPLGLDAPVYMDAGLEAAVGMLAGANKRDLHLTGVDVARDLSRAQFVDLRETRAGDCCSRCGGQIALSRGIEVGQVFALGRRYTEPMEVQFQNQQGKREVATMGCYGIGVSRLMAAVVEQCHDDGGIAWPDTLAPFSVILVSMGKSDEVLEASEDIYRQLQAAGVSVLWDERNERPGVKFKDAELIGIPLQVVIGDRGLKQGVAEFGRRGSERQEIALSAVVAASMAALSAGSGAAL